MCGVRWVLKCGRSAAPSDATASCMVGDVVAHPTTIDQRERRLQLRSGGAAGGSRAHSGGNSAGHSDLGGLGLGEQLGELVVACLAEQRVGDRGRELADRRVRRRHPRSADRAPRLLLDAGEHLHREQRVAAEVEEVVVDADAVDASTSRQIDASASSTGRLGRDVGALEVRRAARPAPAARGGRACRWE